MEGKASGLIGLSESVRHESDQFPIHGGDYASLSPCSRESRRLGAPQVGWRLVSGSKLDEFHGSGRCQSKRREINAFAAFPLTCSNRSPM